MRIGIILHGPEIIDVGSAKRIIDMFNREHDVMAKLGGTMGRTAVLDSGLEDFIDISQGLTPSETILFLKDRIDLAILLNHGKTLDTGRHFGRIVASKVGDSIPFVHIERPDFDGRIIYYSSMARPCAEFVKNILAESGGYDLPLEPGRAAPSHVRVEGDRIIRRIAGAFAGENIRLDGVVIGEIAQPDPEIVCKDGKVVEVRGIRIKTHGLEKLENRKINLFKAKAKTGNIRRTRQKPKIKNVGNIQQSKIAIIDHCAESTFELSKMRGLS